MGDEQLLAQWRDGNSEAGAALVRKHRRALTAFFRDRVPPSEVADMVQDTLLTLVEARARIRSYCSFRSFAFGIARRKLLERGRKRRTAPLGEELEARLAGEAPPASAILVSKSNRDIVIAALRSLSVDDQILLQLSGYEAMKRRELAEVFDVPLNVISGRLHRVRQRLQRVIEKLIANPVDVESTETSLRSYWSSLAGLPRQPD
ncbi:MAG: RNA polymerase sigma factor [Nannocystales bacterium]